jgi:(p)ppGpp synthase/HD superfamily hydrolase
MADFTLNDARAIARKAHAGQKDKLGVDYMEHVDAVAGALIDFDLDIQIAGMLHDVVEDSDITIGDLRKLGVSERSLAAVALVSNNLGSGDYLEHIEVICQHPDATAVKIADNWHNMNEDRVQALEKLTGEPPHPKYDAARVLLWAAGPAIVDTIRWRFDEQ